MISVLTHLPIWPNQFGSCLVNSSRSTLMAPWHLPYPTRFPSRIFQQLSFISSWQMAAGLRVPWAFY